MSAPIHSSDQLIARAIELANEGRKKTVAVAAAQNSAVIGAVTGAVADGFIAGILVGDQKQIEQLASENNYTLDQVEIIDIPDVTRAAHTAITLAADGKADAIMKGFLPTSALLKVVLDKQYDLRGPNTISHCAVLDIPGYHKLLNMTDGGMVVRPDTDQKYQILENAVLIAKALGLSPVKIAVSGPYDKPLNELPHSYADLDYLIPRALKKLSDVVIQGPLPFDLAVSKEAGEKQHCSGEVIGDADIFLVDSIEECNIIAKTLIQFIEAVFAGVIVGAKVPVSLVSRTDTIKNKKASLALAAVLADYYKEQKIFEKGAN